MCFGVTLQAQVNRLITKSSPDHLDLSGNINLFSPYPGNNAANALLFKSQPGIANFGVLTYTPEVGSNLRAFNFYANGDASAHSTAIIPDFLIGKDANNETRIGINLLNPQYTFDVDGTINATNILINGVPLSTTGGSLWAANGSDISYILGDVFVGDEHGNDKNLVVWGEIGSKKKITAKGPLNVKNSNGDLIFNVDPSVDKVDIGHSGIFSSKKINLNVYGNIAAHSAIKGGGNRLDLSASNRIELSIGNSITTGSILRATNTGIGSPRRVKIGNGNYGVLGQAKLIVHGGFEITGGSELVEGISPYGNLLTGSIGDWVTGVGRSVEIGNGNHGVPGQANLILHGKFEIAGGNEALGGVSPYGNLLTASIGDGVTGVNRHVEIGNSTHSTLGHAKLIVNGNPP